MDTFDKLDRVDLQILRTLQENARLTTKELAARVSLSSTPVFERLKRLESGGYIKKASFSFIGSIMFIPSLMHAWNLRSQ